MKFFDSLTDQLAKHRQLMQSPRRMCVLLSNESEYNKLFSVFICRPNALAKIETWNCRLDSPLLCRAPTIQPFKNIDNNGWIEVQKYLFRNKK